MKLLAKRNIGLMAVSLDAATEQNFEALRRRGRVASWPGVLDNLDKLRALKAEKNFTFTVSMTLNSKNFDEIERFVDLGIRYEAEPLVILVSNPYQSYVFQKTYLKFAEGQFDEMFRQIDRSLSKLQKIGYDDAIAQLKQLRSTLNQHRRGENSATRYLAKNQARRVFRMLPGPIKTRLKKALVRIPEAGMS
jgi:MoaA/NifB/PqqE/SkfB family radical SAM enzyme